MSVNLDYPYGGGNVLVDMGGTATPNRSEEGPGGGSSDLNNPIELELSGTIETGELATVLTAEEVYELCQTGTPYFTVTQEQNEEYDLYYVTNKKYFINNYSRYGDNDNTFYDFIFVLLGINGDIYINTMLNIKGCDSTDPISIAGLK